MTQSSPAGRGTLVAAAAVAVMVVAVFAPAITNDFVDLDDPVYILENRHVLGGLNVGSVQWALTALHAANWHPLTWLSHMADISLFGLDPRGHHLVSVALHAATATLLFLVWSELAGSRLAAILGAVIFAVHPLRVESVAWAAQRKDLLALFLGALAILAWVRFIRRRGGRARFMAVIFQASAVSAKPTMVVLPLLLLLIDWWPLGRMGRRAANTPGRTPWRLAVEKLPLAVPSAAAAVLTYVAQARSGAVASFDRLAVGDRLAVAVSAAAGYLAKMLVPARLAVFYPHPAGGAWTGRAWASLAVVAALTVLAWRERRRRPWVLFGWCWHLAALLPVSGLVQVGSQAMADRYTLLSMTGLGLAVGWGAIGSPATDAGRRRALAGAAVWMVLMVPLTVRQEGVWRDTHALYRHALEVTSGNWFIDYNLGARFEKEGRLDEAADHFRRALVAKPSMTDARRGLGNIALAAGRFDEARARYVEVLGRNPADSLAAFNLGVALERLGETVAAADAYRHAITVAPSFPEPRNNLGVLLLRSFRLGEALEQFQAALAIDPGYADARENAGLTLERLGDAPAALVHYREALRLNPGRRGAREGLRRLGASAAAEKER